MHYTCLCTKDSISRNMWRMSWPLQTHFIVCNYVRLAEMVMQKMFFLYFLLVWFLCIITSQWDEWLKVGITTWYKLLGMYKSASSLWNLLSFFKVWILSSLDHIRFIYKELISWLSKWYMIIIYDQLKTVVCLESFNSNIVDKNQS